MTRNVAILIFDQVEVLDFCGPFEVFGVTGRRAAGDPPFSVYTVSEQAEPVLARNGLSVNPNFTIYNCPPPDILLVPGGYGTRQQMHNESLLAWIREQAERVELLLSVCTGALLLAKADLLTGLAATTHWAAMDELKNVAPATELRPTARYVDNDKIILSAGVSAGIDMSLYVVARLLGDAQAAETARHMQYDHWTGSAAKA
ncbi:MAG: DJ-1/PfpI family protein [Ktedonobacteraceae bacterium]|nr:DJ-1/PfpI family protein [Ktedonobacteraceae bacterium]